MKNTLPFLFLVVTVMAGCTKERNASFTLEKNEVYLGEQVKVIPQYENVDHYSWDMGDGTVIDDEQPGGYSYRQEGKYTITLTASHKRNMKKSVVDSKSINVTSWTIDSITLIEIPDMMGWDINSGPDMIFKINDTKLQFHNIFTSDYFIDFPDNLDTTDLPFTLRDLDVKFYYSDWDFRLLDEDIPFPNVQMTSMLFNPYLKGSDNSFSMKENGYDIRFYYHVNE